MPPGPASWRARAPRTLGLVAVLLGWLLVLRVAGPVALPLAAAALAVPRVRAWLRPRRWPWWRVAATAAGAAAVVVAGAVLAPAGRLPLPPAVGTWVTPSYLGRAAVPDPLPALGRGPVGPIGDSPEVTTAWYAGEDCGDLVALPGDRLAAVCAAGAGRVLRVVDAVDLAPLAARTLPDAPAGSPPGCGRALLVAGDDVVVASAAGTVDRVDGADDDLRLADRVDLSGELTAGECLVSVAADGPRLWWAGSGGRVGVVGPGGAGPGGSVRLPGEVANPLRATDGAAYVVTTRVVASVGLGDDGRPVVRWRSVYDAGTGVREGQLSAGAGTSPVPLPGDAATGPLLALVDNADPRVRLRLVDADDGSLVCQAALFEDGASAVEADPVPVGDAAVVVAGSAGWNGPLSALLGRPPAGGLARVDLVDGACGTTWTADVVAPSVAPTVSPVTGLVYAWAVRPGWWGVDAWYLVGVDARTGALRFGARAGTGPALAGTRGGVHLGADAAATVATAGGLVRVVDRFPLPEVTASAARPRPR